MTNSNSKHNASPTALESSLEIAAIQEQALVEAAHGSLLADQQSSSVFSGNICHATARIPLTQGQVALVDVADLPLLARYNWTAFRSRNTWYAKAHIGNNTIYMHRLILLGEQAALDKRKVDHVNANGLDNRRQNLRPVSNSQNMMNSIGRGSARKSRYKGVSVRKHALKPYRACIEVCGKQRHLGYFASEVEAANAYNEAALEYFGPHARTNSLDRFTDSRIERREAA